MKRLTLSIACILAAAQLYAQSAVETPRLTVKGRSLSAVSGANEGVIWYDLSSDTLKLSREAGSFYIIPTAERLYGAPVAAPACAVGDYWLFVDTASSAWRKCSNGTISDLGAGAASLPVSDTVSIVEGSVDATKELRFEVDGFTTGTVRTLTPQNASYTIAGTNIANTFTAVQTISSSSFEPLVLSNSGGVDVSQIRVTGPARSFSFGLNNANQFIIYDNTSATPRLMIDARNTATDPLFQLNGDVNTGWRHPAADTVAHVTAGVDRLWLQPDGPLEFIELASDPTCSAGEYTIYGNSTTSTLRKCQNGTVTNLDTGGGGSVSFVRLQKTAVQSIATVTDVVLTWDSEISDADNLHDNATNNSRITIATAGVYQVQCGVVITATGGSGQTVRVVKNGTFLGGSSRNEDSGAISHSISDLAAATDYYECSVRHDSATAKDTTADLYTNMTLAGPL